MAVAPVISTAEELLNSSEMGRCELVRGELKMMSPAGFEHGHLVVRMTRPLAAYVDEHELGIVTGAETGFLIRRDPDTVRAPDVGFVRAERLPSGPVVGFFPGAPDLAVEVLSPSDSAGRVLAKVHDWLHSGCSLVWIADPETKSVTVYRNGDPVSVEAAVNELDGREIIPGFRLPVAPLFTWPG